eukprot:1729806-Pyramimonas_sp.AAC.1
MSRPKWWPQSPAKAMRVLFGEPSAAAAISPFAVSDRLKILILWSCPPRSAHVPTTSRQSFSSG